MSTSKHVNPGYIADKDALSARLKRIEGQVRGIERMVEDERYCIDILTQISAIQAALDKVGLRLLEQHAAHCVIGPEDAGGAGREDRRDDGCRRAADGPELTLRPIARVGSAQVVDAQPDVASGRTFVGFGLPWAMQAKVTSAARRGRSRRPQWHPPSCPRRPAPRRRRRRCRRRTGRSSCNCRSHRCCARWRARRGRSRPHPASVVVASGVMSW